MPAVSELLAVQKKVGLMGAAVSDFPQLPALIRSLMEKGAHGFGLVSAGRRSHR